MKVTADDLRRKVAGTRPDPSVLGNVGSGFRENREVSGVPEPVLRPETQAGLDALAKQQKADVEAAKQKALEDERREMDAREKYSDEDRERAAELGALQAIQAVLQDNPWLAPGVREAQEKSIEEMGASNRLTVSRILFERGRQRVPIAQDFYVTFQTVSAADDLVCKQVLRDSMNELELYFSTMRDLLTLAVSVDAIGDEPSPALLDPKTNKATKETVQARLDALLEYPVQVTAALAVSYSWYDLRVKRLLLPSSLKNG